MFLVTDAEVGGPVDQKDVFEAFGNMLGEDFSKYQKDMSQGKLHDDDSKVTSEIFENLRDEYIGKYGK